MREIWEILDYNTLDSIFGQTLNLWLVYIIIFWNKILRQSIWGWRQNNIVIKFNNSSKKNFVKYQLTNWITWKAIERVL